MYEDPWQDLKADTILFIADADNSVEEKLLQEWLRNGQQRSGYSGDVHIAIVPIANDSNKVNTKNLDSLLSLSDETLLIPLRVVWKTQLDGLDNRPRIRDLLKGNPRRPTRMQAKRILRRDPSRAMC
jgi:hypothetical protein